MLADALVLALADASHISHSAVPLSKVVATPRPISRFFPRVSEILVLAAAREARANMIQHPLPHSLPFEELQRAAPRQAHARKPETIHSQMISSKKADAM